MDEDWRRPQSGPRAKRQRTDPNLALWNVIPYLFLGLGCDVRIVDALVYACPSLFIPSLVARLRFTELKRMNDIIAAWSARKNVAWQPKMTRCLRALGHWHPPQPALRRWEWMRVRTNIKSRRHLYVKRIDRGRECLGWWYFDDLRIHIGLYSMRLDLECVTNAGRRSLDIKLQGCCGQRYGYSINGHQLAGTSPRFTGKQYEKSVLSGGAAQAPQAMTLYELADDLLSKLWSVELPPDQQ